MKNWKTPAKNRAIAWLSGLLCCSSCVIYSILSLFVRNILGVRALVVLRAFFIPNSELITSSKLRVPHPELKTIPKSEIIIPKYTYLYA